MWFLSLPPALQALFATLFTYAMTALGASCVFLSHKIKQTFFYGLQGLAAGIMIAASFFSLLLPAIECESALPSFLTVTLGFLFGGALSVFFEWGLSRTATRFQMLGDNKSALLYFAVTLHNIPEGLAVGVAFAQGAVGNALPALLLALGIGIQNFPEGLCVALPLRAKGVSVGKSFLFAQGSGAVEVPAGVLGALFATAVAGVMPWALSFSAGAMIAVVCSELIPECFSGNKTLASVGVLTGFCLMMLLDLALG